MEPGESPWIGAAGGSLLVASNRAHCIAACLWQVSFDRYRRHIAEDGCEVMQVARQSREPISDGRRKVESQTAIDFAHDEARPRSDTCHSREPVQRRQDLVRIHD